MISSAEKTKKQKFLEDRATSSILEHFKLEVEGDDLQVVTTEILPSLPEVLGALAVVSIPPICAIVASYCNTVLALTERRLGGGQVELAMHDCYTKEVFRAEKTSDYHGARTCFSAGPGLALQKFLAPRISGPAVNDPSDLRGMCRGQLDAHWFDHHWFASLHNPTSSMRATAVIAYRSLIEFADMKVGSEMVSKHVSGELTGLEWLRYEEAGDFELVTGENYVRDHHSFYIFSFKYRIQGSRTQLFGLSGVSCMLFQQHRPGQLLACFIANFYDVKPARACLFQAEVSIGDDENLCLKLLCIHELRDETRSAYVTRFPSPMLVIPDKKDASTCQAWKLEFGPDGVLKQKFEKDPVVFNRIRTAQDLNVQRGPIRKSGNEVVVQDRAVRFVKENDTGVEVSTLLVFDRIIGAKAQFEDL